MNTLKMVRTMPNTPMQVGEGCTIYSPGSYVTQHDLEKVHLLLNSLGLAQQVPEKMINAIGAVTGCGPAYVSTEMIWHDMKWCVCVTQSNKLRDSFRYTQLLKHWLMVA